MTTANGPDAVKGEDTAIQDFNQRLAELSSKFSTKHPGVSTFVHDTHGVFEKALANPSVFEQTSGIKNTTGYCDAYAK